MATKDSLATGLKHTKVEVIGMIGQVVDIETQMAGMCTIGNMTRAIKAAVRMLMSVTDTSSSGQSFLSGV